MKILQINSAHYRRGGADVVYLNTASLLSGKGNDVSFFSMEDEKNLPVTGSEYFASSNDLRSSSVANKFKKAPAFIYNKDAYVMLSRMLDKKRPDIAHIHLFLGKLSSSILKALKERDIPVVATVHDYRMICPAYLFLDGKRNICEKCKDKKYLNCVVNRCSEGSFFQSAMLSADAYFRKYIIDPINYIDKFIFVSDFIRKKHVEFESRYSSKESLLYNFVPGLSAIVPSYKKGKYFLFYGRLSREKGVGTLLNSARRTGIPLKVVGTGQLYSELSDSPAPNIEFLGHKTGQELWDLISNAGFVIVPSEWYENNPLTIVEAYSFGKPVIGAKIGGIPEIIINEKTGYLFEAGNAAALDQQLIAASNLPEEEYRLMAQAARQFADRVFNPEEHYEKLMSTYECVIREKSSALLINQK